VLPAQSRERAMSLLKNLLGSNTKDEQFAE
jgi:hypothetical protein